jgi:hypothetical protein
LQIDENFKKLIKQLGNAINDSLADSQKISDIMEQIRNSGYDLFLVLEVTIGFNKRGEADAAPAPQLGARKDSETKFRLTSDDTQFLRSLKIRVEEKSK